jgi:tetratricopeptide (TPR) repeat protein
MDYFEQVDLAYQTLKGPALERRLRELTDRCRAEYGERGALYGSMLNELGSYYRGQGRYEASERAFREALELLAQSRGTDSPDYATALNKPGRDSPADGPAEGGRAGVCRLPDALPRDTGRGHILYAAG